VTVRREDIGNAWLRLLVEAVLLPAVLGSRLWASTRTTLREARTQAHRLHEQAQVLTDLQRQRAEDQPLPCPDDLGAWVRKADQR